MSIRLPFAELARYALLGVTLNLFGYLLNAFLLHMLHSELNYPHQFVQAAAVFIVAAFLFATMKLCVFNETCRPK